MVVALKMNAVLVHYVVNYSLVVVYCSYVGLDTIEPKQRLNVAANLFSGVVVHYVDVIVSNVKRKD